MTATICLLVATCAELCAHAACHQLGEYYEGIEKNGAKAADMYEETCFKHGFTESCLSLGNIYIAAKRCKYASMVNSD